MADRATGYYLVKVLALKDKATWIPGYYNATKGYWSLPKPGGGSVSKADETAALLIGEAITIPV